MGGATPATFWQGLASGVGHPVIGLDHLVFLLAAGVLFGAGRLVYLQPGDGPAAYADPNLRQFLSNALAHVATA